MLLWNGRVTGISGIFYGLFTRNPRERDWRLSFILGLIFGGIALRLFAPQSFGPAGLAPDGLVFAAGLLVGFGTVLGSGCTSGHGICGISRLSPRSLVATGAFMGAGILTVALLRSLGAIP
ncbi:MAG: YeeE/YedE family protein [Bdellovibrionaceae bacterium]|nr:YeeE/YedE family protein [Pseudobdellovibrionaceae bacterium]